MKGIVRILTLSLYLVTASCCAQHNEIPDFKYDGNEFNEGTNKFVSNHRNISTYLSTYVHTNHRNVYSLCHQGVALVRFKFDDDGRIKDIACSMTAPQEISIALKNAIKASEKYWTIDKNKKYNKWFIQPFVYQFGFNCTKTNFDSYSIHGGIFAFDDGYNLEVIDCIIFEPITTSSGVDEIPLVPTPKN